MNKQAFRGYFILAGFLVVFFILLIFIPTQKSTPTKIKPTIFPSPTSYESLPSGVTTNIISPTLIPAVDFTGVKEETLPKEIADLTTQKQSLKKKTPLQGNYFTITFDYDQDKFIVELKEPKLETQIKFEQWLKQSYPAISIDRFIIK